MSRYVCTVKWFTLISYPSLMKYLIAFLFSTLDQYKFTNEKKIQQLKFKQNLMKENIK